MKRLGEAVTLGVITCVTGIIIIILPFGNSLEEKTGLPMLFALRGIRPPPEDIVIISIDRVSSEMLNLPEDPKKWPRSIHAQLTEDLARKGASAIVFDLFFTEPQSGRDDAEFAHVISRAGNVVLIEYLKMETLVNARGEVIKDMYVEKYLQPVQPLAESAGAVACFPLPEMSSDISQYWTFRSAGNVPTLPVVVFQLYALKAYDEFIQLFFTYAAASASILPAKKEDIRKYSDIKDIIRELRTRFLEDPSLAAKMMEVIQRPDRYYPDSTKNIIRSLIQIYGNTSGVNYFNFYGPPRTIATVPYHRALNAGDHGPGVDVRDKIVFIGLSENLPSEIKHAGHPTVFSTSDGIDISGVELAATAYANLSEGRVVRPVSFYQHLCIIVFWGIIMAVICYLPRAAVSAVAVSALSLLYLSFAVHQFRAYGIWLPLFIPLFVQTPIAVFGCLIRKRAISVKTIRHFLPGEIASRITAGEKLKDLRTIDRKIFGTCLIADIEDFTKTSEDREPEVISRHRKIYFEKVMTPLRKYDVLIEKTTGDGVVAVWKDSPRIDTRFRACHAAADMMRAVRTYNRSAAVCFPTRIGVNCGHMHIGLVGAEGHYEYDVTGDTVNTAQRIENLNKLLGTRILLSEKVKGCPDFLTRYVGSFIFEGKSKPVAVHELISGMKEADNGRHELCEVRMGVTHLKDRCQAKKHPST
jgi:adenylate cyclase